MLKDYQEDTLAEVLGRLSKARRRWHEDGDRNAFALSATTGAGKTVVAAAAIEALFYGDDEYDFEPDPGAVVLWFSADPTLNEQTRFRLMEASDQINHADLVVVKNTFSAERFAPGKVYFLNTQKLSKTSTLVRGHEQENSPTLSGIETRPDLRTFTIWDTIRNTIEDPSLTLYLIVDEAHQGMGTKKKDQDDTDTIARRLITGHADVPAIPVVWGISATVDRFNTTMSTLPTHEVMRQVWVDSAKVQESGLLKDSIVLDIPTEAGAFETVLLRRAADKLHEVTDDWTAYASSQGAESSVAPLLVFQVPNVPKPDDILAWLETIFDAWPELGINHVAHVFGSHTDLNVGPWSVPYISPERVQDAEHIRVLLAKDAISTGWDCPRAEVMVSFRAAKEKTHITQLLGRMVRTPLARSIPGNDRLNSVDCLLPHFDRVQVDTIVHDLLYGADGKDELPGRRVLIEPVELVPNPSIADEVWDAFLDLPSLTTPRKSVKPVKRLTLLAHELTYDRLMAEGGATVHQELHHVLDAAQNLYRDRLEAAKNDVMTVEGASITYNYATGKQQSYSDFVAAADVAVIEDAYKRAARMISPDVARSYAEHLAERALDTDAYDDELLDAHADIGAFWLVPEVAQFLDERADKMAKDLLATHRAAIRGLLDERQEVYRQIEEMSADPQRTDLAKPSTWLVMSKAREADGTETALPRFREHLMADANGLFPAQLNDWETAVLDRERQRHGFLGWYRNPARAAREALAIPYQMGDKWQAVRPDFLFFHAKADGSVGVSIVDPHGHHLADAIPKLRGLAIYAQQYGHQFTRIDAVTKIDGRLYVLDLLKESVRDAIAENDDGRTLYLSAGQEF